QPALPRSFPIETAGSRGEGYAGPPPGPLEPAVARACASWRWIGILRHGASVCPDLGPGWLPPRPPFTETSTATRSRVARTLETSGTDELVELGRFCVYEYRGVAKQPASLYREGETVPPAPPFNPDLVRLDPDCAALVATGGSSDLFSST